MCETAADRARSSQGSVNRVQPGSTHRPQLQAVPRPGPAGPDGPSSASAEGASEQPARGGRAALPHLVGLAHPLPPGSVPEGGILQFALVILDEEVYGSVKHGLPPSCNW